MREEYYRLQDMAATWARNTVVIPADPRRPWPCCAVEWHAWSEFFIGHRHCLSFSSGLFSLSLFFGSNEKCCLLFGVRGLWCLLVAFFFLLPLTCLRTCVAKVKVTRESWGWKFLPSLEEGRGGRCLVSPQDNVWDVRWMSVRQGKIYTSILTSPQLALTLLHLVLNPSLFVILLLYSSK